METALLVALGLVVGLAIAGLAVFVGRQRTPVADPAAAELAAEHAAAAQLADQRVVELGARVQAMGELLAKAQTQLQSSVHERLDAVTQHLGTSMQTATKHTTDNLQKLNERLAVIDHAQKGLTDLTSQVTSLRDVLTLPQLRWLLVALFLYTMSTVMLPSNIGLFARDHLNWDADSTGASAGETA